MKLATQRVATGYPGLDHILDGLRIGDNVVWNVNNLNNYKFFVTPFVQAALEHNRKVIYLRFAKHKPLLNIRTRNLTVYEFDAHRGFEVFTTGIHEVIATEGKGAFYVFDCLSNLLSAWATDQMIGNFFRVTCPFLFKMDTVAYFSLLQGSHSFKTTARIRETTQVLLNVYKYGDDIYVQPAKVWRRNSPTMFLPHVKKDEVFVPVSNSYSATNLSTKTFYKEFDSAKRYLDHWDRLFLQAEDITHRKSTEEKQQHMIDQLCRVMIGRDQRILSLALTHLSLNDLLEIKSRLIGTGFIGGKTVGMLLARKILLDDESCSWKDYLETHDSFFVGSDVYYSYIIHNDWWNLLMRQKTGECYYEAGAELREKMLHGEFPTDIRDEFWKMLDYYGQYPIIVRSSSLLEDGFGNAFAGKYESYFLVNQGVPEIRYKKLEDVVRKIFASTMSEEALSYRLQRELHWQEEQMALLIQRVSGSYHKHFYFPDLAGVGVSYNSFVWNKDLAPEAGMLRLVLGLGTRAVNRVDTDYPRIVALDAPLKQPLTGFDDERKFTQHNVDLLNISKDSFETVSLLSLENEKLDVPFHLFGLRDRERARMLENQGIKDAEAWVLTFENLFSSGEFIGLMRKLLKKLEKTYNYPVEVEFTVNFPAGSTTPLINVVQCRPMQTMGRDRKVAIPAGITGENTLFRSKGNFMGGSISQVINRVIWVHPAGYIKLTLSEKYELARLIGRVNRMMPDNKQCPTLLMGPGRWGTSTPSMGVPVSFSEVSKMSALAEVAFSQDGFMPELSFGTHFFHDMVETGIFFIALFPDNSNCFFNRHWLESVPDELDMLIPDCNRFKSILQVHNFADRPLKLMADILSQDIVCFAESKKQTRR
ncbi:MAG: phosphoenolpyruvate synthase [Gammaproteobacteria bacterium RBG_16_51_14]|nr:MAG: phosphoenolpyruvate synthase [Gammaproteobacteria bacterium RBG_16_51_14]